MTKRVRRALLALLSIMVVVAAGFVIWVNNPAAPMPEALSALASDDSVRVESGTWIVFTPVTTTPTTGFIFYPGGLVDARAYAPVLRTIAARGYLVVNVPMPLNLAVFGVSRADAVISSFPDIQHWAIGGHSLGGAMAARYAHDHPDSIDGLVLWAAYAETDFSLAGRDVAAASIYGTRDGLAVEEEIVKSQTTLPDDARFVAIEGGNHAQFGHYGSQAGDNPATISRDAQQATVIDVTISVLEQASRR